MNPVIAEFLNPQSGWATHTRVNDLSNGEISIK